MRTKKLLLSLSLFFSILLYLSCNKTDLSSPAEAANKNSLEEKFFNTHRSADPKEKILIDFLKRTNKKENFVEKTAKQIGYPRWDKAFTKSKKKSELSFHASVTSDSSTTYYIPFVRDSDNFVNASMIIKTSQTDTSFTYRCDWEYVQMENDLNSASDAAEHFATFFMVLDKMVFGYNKFNVLDSNLFRTAAGPSKTVMLQSSASSHANNVLALVEFCQDVSVGINDCHYGDTNECTPTCDNCWRCTSYVNYTYCWEEYVDIGDGQGGGGTGTGGSGGGSTPPDPCGGTTSNPQPFASSNIVSTNVNSIVPPCGDNPGGGWTPVPIDDEPPYDPDLDPASYPESTEILLFEQDYRSQMSAQELIIFDGLERIKQLQYLSNAKEALDQAQSLYPNSVLNGNGDAFRHAYFSALNAKVLGVKLAKELGDAHELFPNNNQLENTMDLFNNQYGRNLFVILSHSGQAGHFYKETVNILLRNQKIPNGELQRLFPLGPNSEIILTTQIVPTN